MKPQKEYEFLYKKSIEDARKVFGKNFTCTLKTAPDKEEFEVANILRSPGQRYDTWDNVQVCLTQWPAVFMEVYLRNGQKRVLAIKTRSGGIKELWDMVKPIIDLINNGEIGFESCGETGIAEADNK